MAKLILSMEGSVIREVSLDRERVTIGRNPQNHIRIENLAVNGEHARIVTMLNDSFIEDLGSANGTLVNGNPVRKHSLRNGDVIEIGGCKLKYAAESPAEKASVEEIGKSTASRPPAVKAAASPLGTMDVRARVGDAVLEPT